MKMTRSSISSPLTNPHERVCNNQCPIDVAYKLRRLSLRESSVLEHLVLEAEGDNICDVAR